MSEEFGLLESRLTAVEAAVLANEVAAPFGMSAVDEAGNPIGSQPDPKGRVIWEGFWSDATQVMRMYVPQGAVIVGGKAYDVAVEDGRGESLREGDEVRLSAGIWYLHVDEEEARLNQAEKEEEREGESRKILFETKIIEISEDGGEVVNQFALGAIIIRGKEEQIEPDEKSIDLNGGDDKKRKLQLAHFNDKENDEAEGLTDSLEVNLKTGKVSSASNLMILARQNGKLVYVPMKGSGREDEEEPEEEETEDDPCDHDKEGGAAGGVSPDRESGGGVAAGGVGGVLAGGEKHSGDDDCNC